jgi:hypothetical protein
VQSNATGLLGVDAIRASWARLSAGETPPQEGLVLAFGTDRE